MITQTTFDGTVVRIGFGPGPDGPCMVSIDVDDLAPPFNGEASHHFQLNGVGDVALTVNGTPVTFQGLVMVMLGDIPFRTLKVRIVWEEHSYVGVREAHFTVP